MSAISKKNIQEKISIPSGLTSSFKRELGERIIEEIRERTSRGIDQKGNRFKAYSPAYKDSLDFKNAGKSNTVNISATGDTMAELSVIDISDTYITIGYPLDHEDAGKVNGIVTGEFGNASPVTKGRDFIGLPQRVVSRLVAQMRTEPQFADKREEDNNRINSILARFF
jgi:hypothetical protein